MKKVEETRWKIYCEYEPGLTKKTNYTITLLHTGDLGNKGNQSCMKQLAFMECKRLKTLSQVITKPLGWTVKSAINCLKKANLHNRKTVFKVHSNCYMNNRQHNVFTGRHEVSFSAGHCSTLKG